VPLSVLSNWEVQIKDHIAPGAASSFVYYGAGRNVSQAGLMKHDIVITTYNVVVSEWGALSGGSDGKPTKKKQKTSSSNSLFGVKWKVRTFNKNTCLTVDASSAHCLG
jgi:SWI/SNF-related matrix-associated actin-dependent regulator of chromatin subfamily A3